MSHPQEQKQNMEAFFFAVIRCGCPSEERRKQAELKEVGGSR
jgi:hypothetical protein